MSRNWGIAPSPNKFSRDPRTRIPGLVTKLQPAHSKDSYHVRYSEIDSTQPFSWLKSSLFQVIPRLYWYVSAEKHVSQKQSWVSTKRFRFSSAPRIHLVIQGLNTYGWSKMTVYNASHILWQQIQTDTGAPSSTWGQAGGNKKFIEEKLKKFNRNFSRELKENNEGNKSGKGINGNSRRKFGS